MGWAWRHSYCPPLTQLAMLQRAQNSCIEYIMRTVLLIEIYNYSEGLLNLDTHRPEVVHCYFRVFLATALVGMLEHKSGWYFCAGKKRWPICSICSWPSPAATSQFSTRETQDLTAWVQCKVEWKGTKKEPCSVANKSNGAAGWDLASGRLNRLQFTFPHKSKYWTEPAISTSSSKLVILLSFFKGKVSTSRQYCSASITCEDASSSDLVR